MMMPYLCKAQIKVSEELKKTYKKAGMKFPLNKKECLYLAYIMHGKNVGKTIGQTCKDLKTTAWTLCRKTAPNVHRYLDSLKED